MASVDGCCLCGAVSFQIDIPVKWCSHCHCSLCRRAHGAGFVTWFGVNFSDFRLFQGETSLRWYESSPGAQRGFCSVCGSTMFFKSPRWEGEIHIALAFMQGEIDKAPMANVYWDTHVPWIEGMNELKKLGGETGVEPIDADE